MKTRIPRRFIMALAGICTVLAGRPASADEDFLDTLGDRMKVAALGGQINAHLGALLDFEGYYLQQPPPGLIDTNHDFIFNPRLTFNLDVQIGPKLYFFGEARFDRGLDPADTHMRGRLDQYALRFTPWDDGRFNVQIGKFATVIGNYAGRSDSWSNPFITAPLPYENRTAMYDTEGPESAADFHSYRFEIDERYEENPIIWGPAYGTGISISGALGKFDYAVEMKNAPVSSPPEYWDACKLGWEHPVFNARVGVRPDEAWNIGFSSSVGPYLVPEAADTLPPGRGIGDYRAILLGQDVSYAWHHWQLWAEFFETRFEVPYVGNADTFAYYIEAKYKFTPQLFGALRWNQQVYSSVPDGSGGTSPWGNDIWRIDAAITYRFTPHIQGKLQYSFLHQDFPFYENQHLVALQVTVRF